MAGLTDTFGKEKRTRFLEMFLPLVAGIGASYLPNGGAALQGLGTVMSGTFGRREEEAKLRQQDTQFEAMKADADDQLNAMNAELARLEGTPYEYDPNLTPERNRLVAAERNARINNLKTQIRTTSDTFSQILQHAAQTRDPAKAIAALGVFMSSINSMSGMDESLSRYIAEQGILSNKENIEAEERQETSEHRGWQRSHEEEELRVRRGEVAENRQYRIKSREDEVKERRYQRELDRYERLRLESEQIKQRMVDSGEAKDLDEAAQKLPEWIKQALMKPPVDWMTTEEEPSASAAPSGVDPLAPVRKPR